MRFECESSFFKFLVRSVQVGSKSGPSRKDLRPIIRQTHNRVYKCGKWSTFNARHDISFVSERGIKQTDLLASDELFIKTDV